MKSFKADRTKVETITVEIGNGVAVGVGQRTEITCGGRTGMRFAVQHGHGH